VICPLDSGSNFLPPPCMFQANLLAHPAGERLQFLVLFDLVPFRKSLRFSISNLFSHWMPFNLFMGKNIQLLSIRCSLVTTACMIGSDYVWQQLFLDSSSPFSPSHWVLFFRFVVLPPPCPQVPVPIMFDETPFLTLRELNLAVFKAHSPRALLYLITLVGQVDFVFSMNPVPRELETVRATSQVTQSDFFF